VRHVTGSDRFPCEDCVSTPPSDQPGAIVSRTLLKRPGGTITVFAFDAGQSFERAHGPLTRLCGGSMAPPEVTIAGVLLRVAVGQAVLALTRSKTVRPESGQSLTQGSSRTP
jgi:hypothetical protein